MSSSSLQYDAFISYSRLDEVHAEQLAEVLSRQGIRFWWDRELKGRIGDWRRILAPALVRSKTLVVLVSPRSLGSQ